ncbi:MAG: hypothetical protein ACYSYM_15845 [Planctomycetota bacterium]
MPWNRFQGRRRRDVLAVEPAPVPAVGCELFPPGYERGLPVEIIEQFEIGQKSYAAKS